MMYLRWLERVLLVVGIVLALWCANVIYQAHRTANMAIPPPVQSTSRTASGTQAAGTPATGTTGPTAAGALPGDSGSGAKTPVSPSVARGAWLARLDAPTIKMRATVLEGSDDATLARGAGHIEDTAYPGDHGNFGVAGHRDTIFRPLRFIKIGDPLTVTTRDRIYHYRVENTAIVGPDDVYVLDDAGHPTMTLVTCYPFQFIGHAPRRFIVSANLVGTEDRTAP
jgi:sortase A